MMLAANYKQNMRLFKKPVDLRSKNKTASITTSKKCEQGIDETGKVHKDISWWRAINMALAPIVWLFKFLDYVHLLIFAIFGALSLYFGFAGLPANTWVESTLLICVGLVLLGWPIAHLLENRR